MKKKIFTISLSAAWFMLLLAASSEAYSQAPSTFNYQAVLRDAGGNLRVDESVDIALLLHQGSSTGTVVYEETHSTTTNAYALVNLEVGSVNPGDFSSVDWSAGPYFLEVKVDGTSMGTSQLLSVPYALYAASSEFPADAFTGWDQDASDDFSGDYNDLTNKPADFDDADADPANELQDLSLGDGTLSISSGNSVDLNGLGNRTIALPAGALTINPTSTITTPHALGILWQQSFSAPAFATIHKPSNYQGEEVKFSIFFRTTTSTAGVVDFFIRPRSYDPLDGFEDAASINGTAVNVSGSSGFGTVYVQEFTIPASRLTDNWWIISMQRDGSQSTYADDVVVMSVALTY